MRASTVNIPPGRGRPKGSSNSETYADRPPYCCSKDATWTNCTTAEVAFLKAYEKTWQPNDTCHSKSYITHAPRPSQQPTHELAKHLASNSVHAAVRPLLEWTPERYFAELSYHPCPNGNKSCKPTRFRLDKHGPQPVVGIGCSLLLWPSLYRCSACVTEARHPCVFKSTTQRALRVLPEYIYLEFCQDVYFPLFESDESESATATAATATPALSRNRLLLTKPLGDLINHATVIKLSFNGLHTALCQIAAERTISQQRILCAQITKWCSENVSDSQITQWLTNPHSHSTVSTSEIKQQVRELKAPEFLTRLGIPLVKAPGVSFMEHLFTTAMFEMRVPIEQRMLNMADELICWDAHMKRKYASVIDTNGKRVPAFQGFVAISSCQSGAILACRPVHTTAHQETEPLIKGIAKRYEILKKEVKMFCTDNGRADRDMLERNGMPTPTEDLFHFMKRILDSLNQREFPTEFSLFARQLADCFFDKRRLPHSQTRNPARKLREGPEIVEAVHALVSQYDSIPDRKGFITGRTYLAVAQVKKNVDEGYFGIDHVIDGKRANTSILESNFKRINESATIGGTQSAELYLAKIIQIVGNINLTADERWNGVSCYGVSLFSGLLAINELFVTLSGSHENVPFPNFDVRRVESGEGSFFLPSHIHATTAVPVFNPTVISKLVSCVNISEDQDGQALLRVELPPDELQGIPLLAWSAPTGSSNANLNTLPSLRPPGLRVLAGQPLSVSVKKLVELKTIEFMSLFNEAPFSTATCSVADGSLLKLFQSVFGGDDVSLTSALWTQLAIELQNKHGDAVLSKLKLSKAKSPSHLREIIDQRADFDKLKQDLKLVSSAGAQNSTSLSADPSALHSIILTASSAALTTSSSHCQLLSASSTTLSAPPQHSSLQPVPPSLTSPACGCPVNNRCSKDRPSSAMYTKPEDQLGLSLLKGVPVSRNWKAPVYVSWSKIAERGTDPGIHHRGEKSIKDHFTKNKEAQAIIAELKSKENSEAKEASKQQKKSVKVEAKPTFPYRPLSTVYAKAEKPSVSSMSTPVDLTQSWVHKDESEGEGGETENFMAESEDRAVLFSDFSSSGPVFNAPVPPSQSCASQLGSTLLASSSSSSSSLPSPASLHFSSQPDPVPSEATAGALSQLNGTDSPSTPLSHNSMKPTVAHKVSNPSKGLNDCEKELWESTWKLRTEKGYFKAKDYIKHIYRPLLNGKINIIDSFRDLSTEIKQHYVNLATGCRADTTDTMFVKYKNTYLQNHPEEDMRDRASVNRDKKRGRGKPSEQAEKSDSEGDRQEKKSKSDRPSEKRISKKVPASADKT